jgi:hypothetical protein
VKQSRTPIVSVVPRLPQGHQARSAWPAAGVVAPRPSVAAKPPPSTNRSSRDERERLAARGAPHVEAIRQLLDKLSAANGGAWPRHVHVAVAEALGLPRGVVHAFLSGLREQERRRTPRLTASALIRSRP